MSWFSFLRKKKQEPAPDESEFYSHAESMPAAKRSRSRGKDGEPAADPMLPEKKRARRRLIGAVALTLGLIIVLPMVFDSEPQPISQDITIHIPSRDKAARMPVASAPSAPAASVAEKSAEPAPVPGKAASPEASVPLTARASVAASVAVRPSAPEASKTAEAKPVPAKPDSPAAKKGEVDEIAEIVKAANAQQGKVMIQVAALASQEKVRELQAKLKKAGIESRTQKVPTKDGDRIRVRIGPFASKAEAEKTCPKLTKMNLKCTIVSN